MGLTQEELAEVAQVHPNTVSNLERAVGSASLPLLSSMLVHLGCRGLTLDAYGFHPIPGNEPHPFYPTLVQAPPTMLRIIGQHFLARRRACGLTLAEASRIAGLHPNTIWNLEHGLVAPSATTAFLLARALEIAIIGGTPEGIRMG